MFHYVNTRYITRVIHYVTMYDINPLNSKKRTKLSTRNKFEAQNIYFEGAGTKNSFPLNKIDFGSWAILREKIVLALTFFISFAKSNLTNTLQGITYTFYYISGN